MEKFTSPFSALPTQRIWPANEMSCMCVCVCVRVRACEYIHRCTHVVLYFILYYLDNRTVGVKTIMCRVLWHLWYFHNETPRSQLCSQFLVWGQCLSNWYQVLFPTTLHLFMSQQGRTNPVVWDIARAMYLIKGETASILLLFTLSYNTRPKPSVQWDEGWTDNVRSTSGDCSSPPETIPPESVPVLYYILE